MPEPDVPQPTEGESLLDTDGQVHWVASDGDVVLAAAGTDGLFMLDAASGAMVAHERLPGIAQHVWLGRGLIYTSHGTGGLIVWERNGAALRQVGAWHDAASIRQVFIPTLSVSAWRWRAAAHSSRSTCRIPPRRPLAEHRVMGLVYARLLAGGLVGDRYAVGARRRRPQLVRSSGPQAAMLKPASPGARLCPIVEGVTVHEGVRSSSRRRLLFRHAACAGEPRCGGPHQGAGRFFSGNPQSVGTDRLVVTNRATGSPHLDVSNAEAPKTCLPSPARQSDRPIRVGNRLLLHA